MNSLSDLPPANDTTTDVRHMSSEELLAEFKEALEVATRWVAELRQMVREMERERR